MFFYFTVDIVRWGKHDWFMHWATRTFSSSGGTSNVHWATGICFLLFKLLIYFIHILCFKLLNLKFDSQRVSTADLEVVDFINIKKKISVARERQMLREDLDIIWYDTPHGKRWYDYIADIFCLRNLFNEDNHRMEEEEDEDL